MAAVLFRLAAGLTALAAALGLLSCTAEGSDPAFPGQDIRMTFLHTTDSHSKLLPFKYVPNFWDEGLGIKACPGDKDLAFCQSCLNEQEEKLFDPESEVPDPGRCAACMSVVRREGVCTECLDSDYDHETCYACLSEVRESGSCTDYSFGGAARAAWVIGEERGKALRSAHVDTGDFSQGAPIYNLFSGEPEVRVLAAMGCDAGIIGNHEFDSGAQRLAEVLYRFAAFPVLNANYMFEAVSKPGSTALGQLVDPFFIKDYEGLKIGYIGMGNVRSLNSLGDADNSMGVRAIDTEQVVKTFVPMIRGQVDLVVLLSHLGLHSDIEAAKAVPGIDIIFGGHDHIVTDPPLEVQNPDGQTTLVVHSGVNFKCLGRLDVVVRDRKIVAHDFRVIPVTSAPDPETGRTLGEDPMVARVLYDYEWELGRAQNLEREIGVALDDFPRYATGDSPLGNLVADAIRARRRVDSDLSMTNTLGIRADLDKGPITMGKTYEIFPFENSITTMYMSGTELHRLFDYAAARTAAYGCKTQIQISGARIVLDCNRGMVKRLEINELPVVEDYELKEPYVVFNLATNDYIADGGSGFDILEQNTTKTNTMLSLRDVVIDYIEEAGEISPVVDGRIQLIR